MSEMENSTSGDNKPPKPSGIRPPSKIGRMCSSGTPKPAVPVPSKNDTTLETMRKISDDYSRKQLADVQEADEESDTFQDNFGSCSNASRERKPSTCSTYSITSMDALWESNPRRLSEAGLRRTSDHSIVLTEDTDGFIIGDKVYVGGSKSGQIAYIGDTQFAPGEWAGVVLDEPIGKNDGSVAGVRYFQCEPKKGVFSRLTRLTREPISLPSPSPASPASERGSIISDRPPVSNGKAKSPGSVTSSIPRARRSSSPNGSIRSFSSRISTSTAATGELRLGERVIVSSSQGSKAGTLRFIGLTDFATGQWCGVELDDPIGKNDGSVEGKRYFECAPRFGLFAPLAKVSRSPSNRRPGTCAVHGRGSPPDSLASSMMSHTGSVRPRLGVTSLGSGNQRLSGPRAVSTPMSAKNTLQELLREKQQHIELLMNELDLEKSELAKTTMKVDNTLAEMELMKSELLKNIDEVSKLKTERDTVMRQLEDEKQKVDDLMFRAEEDNIHKEDFSKFKEELLDTKEKQTATISSLNADLVKLKSQLEEVHMQNDLLSSQYKAESDVLISQHKDELQAGQDLASQLQNLLDEAHTLLREKVAEREVLDKSHFDEMSKLKLESERSINDLKTKLSETQTELSTYISSSNEKLNEAECKISSLNEKLEKNTIESNGLIRDLRSQLEQKQIMLDVKVQESNEVISTSKELELNYKKDLEKLKMQNSSTNLDLETAIESKNSLEAMLEKVKSELNNLKSTLMCKETEFNSALTSESQERDALLTEMEELKNQLSIKQSQIDKLTKDNAKESNELQKQIEDHTSELKKNQDEFVKLKNSIKTLEAEVSQGKILKETYEKQIKEKDLDMETKSKAWIDEKSKLKIEFEEHNIVLTSEIGKNAEEVKNLTQKIVEQQQIAEEMLKKYSDVNANFTSTQSANVDLERQLKIQKERNNELQSFKELLEKQINDITSNSMCSNEQLSVTSNKLIEAENSIQCLKDAAREKNDEYQKMVLDHDEFKNQTNNEINTMMERLKALDNEKVLFEDEIKNLKVQLDTGREIIDKTNAEFAKFKQGFENEKSELENNVLNEVAAKNKLKDDLESSEKNIKELNTRIETLENNANLSENTLKQKVDELSISQNELIKQLEQSQNNEKNLENMYNKLVKESDESKESFKSSIHTKEEKEKDLCDNMVKLQDSYELAQKSLTDKEVLTKDLQHKLSELEFEYKSNVEIALEKDRQINVSKVEIKKVLEEKHNLEKNLNSKISEYEMLQQKNVELGENVTERDSFITKQRSDLDQIKTKLLLFFDTIDHVADGNLNDVNKCDLDTFKMCELLDQAFSFKEKCNALKVELESTKGTHLEEITEMKVANEDLFKKITLSEQLVEKLKVMNEQSHEIKQLMEASEEDAKKMALLNEAEKNKYEELHKQLLNDIENLKNDRRIESDNLKAQMDALKTQLTDKNKECQDIVLNKNELQLSLEAANHSSDMFKNKVVELESALDQKQKEDHNENKKMLTEMQNMKDTHNKEINNLKNDVAALNDKVSKKRRDVESYKKQYLTSNSDLEKYQLLNDQMKQEIIALNNKLKEFENNNDILKSSKIPTVETTQKSNIDTKRLIEEKEEVEGQVSFLNSVIIDMQRKNEELKARVEILEMGVTPQEAEEFNYSGLKNKNITPRMFCDICDKFDAHETEDCPRQTNDDIEVNPSDKKKVPEPRPYCELCEVFGHSTENCDEEETY